MVLGNVLNFLYNAYLSRAVSVEEFGLVSLVGSFLSLSSVPLNALSRTVTHKSAYYFGKYGTSIPSFWASVRGRALTLGIIIATVWVLATPLLTAFFHSPSYLPFLLFTPVWFIAAVAAVDGGFLGGNLRFSVLGVIVALEALSKLLFTWLIVSFGYRDFLYAALPLSMMVALVIGWRYARAITQDKTINEEENAVRSFPKKFYTSSLLWRVSAVVFLSFDTILAQHYLSPSDAGHYALVALTGKMIFFVGGLFTQFLVPLVSRAEGALTNSKRIFSLVFFSSLGASMLVYLGVGLLGSITAPLLFGANTAAILTFLPLYGLGMLCFTAASSIISFHQIKERHLFPAASFALALVQVVGIVLYHRTIMDIVMVMTTLGIAHLLVAVLLHFFYSKLSIVGRNIHDFFGAFVPQPLPRLEAGGLRVLILNWRDTRHVWVGGAETYAHEVAKGLVAAGHSVTFFCGNDGYCARRETIDGVHVIRRGGFYTVYLWAFFYYLLQFRGKFDIIVDCHNGIPFFTPLYAKETVYGLMHHVHQEVFWYSLSKPLALVASFLENKMMPRIYRDIKFITVSDSTRKDMEALKLGNAGIEVVYPGVDLARFSPGEKSRNPLVLYLGRLKAYKSVHVLLEAFRKVVERVPNAELVIAGTGEEEKRLKQLAWNLRIADRVRFAGKVSEEEKIELFRRAWVFANPSLMEGWGITTIEANACGTPVVAANVPGLRDSVQNPHTGYLVTHGDSAAFADKLVVLLEDAHLRDAMSQEAMRWASQFEWKKVKQAFLTLLTVRHKK
jgi:glycosyltransferase involved in cell wall biosynthesis/O-antigen/teichoic acid export membrane protein